MPSILNCPEISSLLPNELQIEENRPVVTHSLSKTIRNTILNYKETINDIVIDDDVSFTINSEPCDCSSSVYCDPDHKHILTGDLRIVKNSKLRKLLTKGPNYRESKGIDFEKAKTYITLGIEGFIDTICDKNKNFKNKMLRWKENIMTRIMNKIDIFKQKKNFLKKRSPILKDPDVRAYLKDLQKKFVIVTVDKASNNFAFICKRFYVSRTLKEITDNNTYSKSVRTFNDITEETINFCKRFGIQIEEKSKQLPSMYWIPKMHKKPVGARFIISSKKCTTKSLSKIISNIFKV